MKQSILIVIGGALASLLAIPQMAAFFARSARSESDAMRDTDEIRQTFKLTPGTRVEISSIRGPVEIETSNGDTAEILITRNGRPAAVLVSADEYDSLCETVAIRSDRELMAEIRRGLRGLKRGSKIYTLEELLPEE